ncbi:CBN-HER-1 protein [Caenorhabditis brenneri]|uniref:CBN-HER-1 protein n=1 Tax=Caenorhabditis brenneri TaxID=135651 RepID=G0NPP0_CAEBE|nr:CBN-HER-1 protein [Caenorhabditis brenneri]
MKGITIILLFGIIGVLNATFTREQIKKASRKCCTPKRQECCMEMIKFGSPINCGYEKHPKFPKVVYDCLQGQLFPNEPEKRMELEDSGCCSVYHHDQNDPNRRCEHICKTSLTSPALDAATKISRIQSCTLLDNDNALYGCFEKCQARRRKGQKIEVLQFSEYCNYTLIQKRPIRGAQAAIPNHKLV